MADRTRLPHGAVRLWCPEFHLDLVVLMGDAAPKVTGGLGGWEVTARPRQVSMTTWAGVEPYQVELSLMLDGHAAGTSVEGQLARIMAVARGDNESEPGILRVEGIAMPPAPKWIVEGVEFGDALLDARTGERTRQPLSVTLREYVPPEYLQLRRGATQGSKGKTRTITTKKGDTPAKVAARQRCTFAQVRALNRELVTKANQHLDTGTKLRVPLPDAKRRKAPTAHKK